MNTVCPNCSTSLSTATDFCLACGTLVNAPKTQCLKCKQQVDSNAPFCTHCGTSFHFNEQPKITTTPSSNFAFQSPPIIHQKQSKTFLVALSAFAVLAFIIILGGGYWLLSKSNQTSQFSGNSNFVNQRQTYDSSNTTLSSSTKLQNPSTSASTDSVNSSSATLNSSQSSAIREEVSNALFRWKSDSEALNFSAYMNNYAGTVDYYRAGQVDRSRVSKDKQRAFRLYNSIKIELKNLHITPEAEGNKATVIVDKSWYFQGRGKTNEGEVQQQLTLEKISDYWYITGEKDLKVYYSKSY